MAAAALPLIQQGVSAVTKIAGALFAAHTARLAAAKNENAAVAQIIAPFDADVQSLAQLWNSGQVTPSQFISYCQQVDQATYNYMRNLVSKSGTAWSDTNGMAGKCDKTCTAACCVYFGDLGPVLSGMIVAAGGQGKWGPNDPRISQQAGGFVITVPEVFASKYGGIDRKGYTITMVNLAQKPANPTSYAQTGLPQKTVPLGKVSEGTPAGQTSTFSSVSQAGLVNASVLASAPGLSYSAPAQTTGGSVWLILGGLGGLAAILALAVALHDK
jgi:hypothetical protein